MDSAPQPAKISGENQESENSKNASAKKSAKNGGQIDGSNLVDEEEVKVPKEKKTAVSHT